MKRRISEKKSAIIIVVALVLMMSMLIYASWERGCRDGVIAEKTTESSEAVGSDNAQQFAAAHKAIKNAVQVVEDEYGSAVTTDSAGGNIVILRAYEGEYCNVVLSMSVMDNCSIDPTCVIQVGNEPAIVAAYEAYSDELEGEILEIMELAENLNSEKYGTGEFQSL